MAVISKGITLSYKGASDANFTVLTNLQEIPELGGVADAIEITTLADVAHKYTDGILNYGDAISFKFLYDQTQFLALDALEGSKTWKVELPDELTATFSGSAKVKLDGAGVGVAVTYTLNVRPDSAIVFAGA